MLGSNPLGRRRGLARLARAVLLPSLAAAALLAFAGTASAAPRTFYVDCSAGNDSSAGTGNGSLAWRSLTRANSAALAAGDKLLLRRNCTWTGPLRLTANGTAAAPIYVGAYSTGAPPMIQNAHDNVEITGSYFVIEDLVTRADAPFRDANCGNAPAGWRVGFRFYSGSSYNTLRYSTATGLYNGIRIEFGSHHNKILRNHLIKNNMKDEHGTSDAGAMAILIEGDDNEIAGNDISGSDACSPKYGRDGSAIEMGGGKRNSIHHNVAIDNNNFIELGNSRNSDTTVAYNKVYSSLKIANFLVTRGVKDTSWGPIYGTRAYNNSVYLTGANSYAVQCLAGCTPSILTLRNNIIVSQDRIGFADGSFDEGNNIYWQPQGNPKVYWTMSSTSRKADPRWLNPAALDFRLNTGSPAIDTGSMVPYNAGYRTDYNNVPVPRGAAPDIGAFER